MELLGRHVAVARFGKELGQGQALARRAQARILEAIKHAAERPFHAGHVTFPINYRSHATSRTSIGFYIGLWINKLKLKETELFAAFWNYLNELGLPRPKPAAISEREPEQA
jgi:hypothetical protein